MLTSQTLRAAFDAGLTYDRYLAAAPPHEQEHWRSFGARVTLTPAQLALISTFSRRLNVLVVSGSWCGDCVQQVPIIAAIASAHAAPAGPLAPGIALRLLERDAHREFSAQVSICGGLRVPVALFLNEDLEFVALAGDRLLSRYRALAARQLGAFCPLPGAPVPADEIAATTGDWLDEFERVALLLRLSPKLRHRHAD
ncbi:MAG: thioredoxin family protein [Phycisphaerales bacterium]